MYKLSKYEFKLSKYEFKLSKYEFKLSKYEFKLLKYEFKLSKYEFKLSKFRSKFSFSKNFNILLFVTSLICLDLLEYRRQTRTPQLLAFVCNDATSL